MKTFKAQLCDQGCYCPPRTGYGFKPVFGDTLATAINIINGVLDDDISPPIPCPAGTYNDQFGIERKMDCTICPKGHWCDGTDTVPGTAAAPAPGDSYPRGTIEPIACPPGSYNPSEGMECPDLDLASCPNHACLECPGGSTCPDSGMAAPNECGIGKYSPPGQSYVECPDCLPGYYCDNSTTSEDDMINNKPCPPGTNCGESEGPQGEIPELVQNSCPLGYYCPGTEASADPNDQTTDPQPCPPGTYGAEMGLTSESEVVGDFNVRFCLPCPEGYYCPNQGNNDNAADPNNRGIPNCAVTVDENNEDYKDYYDTNVYPCAQFSECPPGQYCEAGRVVN